MGNGIDLRSSSSLGTPPVSLQSPLPLWWFGIKVWKQLETGEMVCTLVRRIPPPPGILYEYQNKGVAPGGFCMNLKGKELENLDRKKRGTRAGSRSKWGQKIRMEIDHTRQCSIISFTMSIDICSVFEWRVRWSREEASERQPHALQKPQSMGHPKSFRKLRLRHPPLI